MTEAEKPDLTSLTVQLLSAYVSNNTLPSNELAELIRTTRGALEGDGSSAKPAAPELTPAVSVRKSLASRDHIISLIDGKPYKSLKRHLSSHGLTPNDYRARYNLASDYPMVAPGYSEQRREVAQRLGLGRKKADSPSEAVAPVPSVEQAAAIAQVPAEPSLTSAAAVPPAGSAPSPTAKASKRATPKAKTAGTAASRVRKSSPQGKPSADSGPGKKDGATEAPIDTAADTSGQAADVASVADAAPTKALAGRKTKTAAAGPDAAVVSPEKPARAVGRDSAKVKATGGAPKAKKATAPKRSRKAASPAAPESERTGADVPATEAIA